jgi:hypothetical protein
MAKAASARNLRRVIDGRTFAEYRDSTGRHLRQVEGVIELAEQEQSAV